jgi:hypothetical protein
VPDNPTTVWTAVEADPVRREGPEVRIAIHVLAPA